jgi:hypothetical protein
MSWTKRELIAAAFAEIGLAAYVFDLQPEQLEAARRQMDAMMAAWDATGIRCGYTVPTTADGSDLDNDSGVTDAATETVYLNLAIRLAPSYGKSASLETKAAARTGYTALLTKAARPSERQFDTALLPPGAGNRWRLVPQPEPITPIDGVTI